jgi:hypothetical protein
MRDRADHYNTLDYWVELAKLLERGKFDALFLADVLGVYDVYRGSPHAAIANAVQVPVNDPLLLIPAMAYVTRGALVLMSGWTGVDCELMDRLSRSPVRHKDFLTGDNAVMLPFASDGSNDKILQHAVIPDAGRKAFKAVAIHCLARVTPARFQ